MGVLVFYVGRKIGQRVEIKEIGIGTLAEYVNLGISGSDRFCSHSVYLFL